MTELEFLTVSANRIAVKCDCRTTGFIRIKYYYNKDGFTVIDSAQYFPKGSAVGGEIFKTLAECKKSLERD